MNRTSPPKATRKFRWRWQVLVIWLGMAIHAVACVGVLAVAPGTEANASVDDRLQWIAAHERLWQANWIAWMGASSSLLAILIVWGEHLAKFGVAWKWRITTYTLVAVGLACDLMGEITLITLMALPDVMVERVQRYQILSPGIANGLYCVSGLLLSSAAWRVRWLRGRWALLSFTMWAIGLALSEATLFALAGYDAGRAGMVVLGGAVMALFLPWAGYLGWRVGCDEVVDER